MYVCVCVCVYICIYIYIYIYICLYLSIYLSICLPNNRDATGTDAKDGDAPDDDADQLGQRAAGVGDVVSTQKAPKPRYGQKKAEPKPAASKRGHGTQHAKQAKTKVAPPKKTKTKPE